MAITLERMRADIAAILHEDPEEIGLDDNLADLGLDSMRVMNLLVTWTELGADFEFGEAAEDFTLAGWWQAVQRHQAARA
jgi:aryl carrier-like protein